jgi:hypothetical protein
MQDFWPSCGFSHLRHDERGWLVPGDAWFRLALARPELALVDDSCAFAMRCEPPARWKPGTWA